MIDVPQCPACGDYLTCARCGDRRPTAEDLTAGWQLLTPLGRWEHVERVHQETRFSPVQVWTTQSGPDYPWWYSRSDKVDAVRPVVTFHGPPEIRVVEQPFHDGGMYAIACQGTNHNPPLAGPNLRVIATTAGRGHGWTILDYYGGEQTATHHDSKAAARSAVHAAARRHAKALNVKLVLPTPRKAGKSR